MALDKATFVTDFQQLMADMRTRDVDSDNEFATRLADMLEIFVKSGDGKITSSAMVAGSTPVTATNTVVVKFE